MKEEDRLYLIEVANMLRDNRNYLYSEGTGTIIISDELALEISERLLKICG